MNSILKASLIYISIITILLSLVCILQSCNFPQKKSRQLVIQTIRLTNRNFAYLNGMVTQENLVIVENELIQKDQLLGDNESLYLVVNSPGGDVDAGVKFINAIRKSLKHSVKTITIKSQSMAFFIVQFLGERLIVENGQMMTHQPIMIFTCPEKCTEFVHIRESARNDRFLESQCAWRMGISLEKYYDLTATDLYLNVKDSLRLNTVDRIVKLQCDDDVKTQRILVLDENPITGKMEIALRSKCPLNLPF